MAVTPNYSWPVPDDTDLVKDGAEAIRDLGNAIDTTVDGLPSGGLVHIETVTVGSGVSAVNIDDVFSATFDNYLVVADVRHSTTDNQAEIRLRKNGTDNTANNYIRQRASFSGTTLSTSVATLTFFSSVAAIDDLAGNFVLTFINPFVNTFTEMQSTGGNMVALQFTNCRHSVVDTFDGFTLSTGSGTFASGTIRIYGYKN